MGRAALLSRGLEQVAGQSSGPGRTPTQACWGADKIVGSEKIRFELGPIGAVLPAYRRSSLVSGEPSWSTRAGWLLLPRCLTVRAACLSSVANAFQLVRRTTTYFPLVSSVGTPSAGMILIAVGAPCHSCDSSAMALFAFAAGTWWRRCGLGRSATLVRTARCPSVAS